MGDHFTVARRLLSKIADYLQSKTLTTQHALNAQAIIFTFATVFSLLVFYRVLLHPLAHVPGPFLAKVSGFWRTYHYFRGTWHDDIIMLHKKYGRVVRIAPNEVAIVDEQAMKRLYGHGQNAPKTDWYKVWEVPDTAPQLFAERDKKVHGFLRKRLAGAYSMTSMMKYEVHIQGCLDLMLSQLAKHAKKGHAVDMSNWTNAFAFDVVGELAYGQQLGHLKTESDVNGLRKTIFNGFFLISNFGHIPTQGWAINSRLTATIAKLLGAAPPMDSFREWTSQKVRDRMDNMTDQRREDMLAHFCRMKDAKGNPASFGEVLMEALNIIGAGADTTSIGMRTCLYRLCLDKKAYARVQNEVDQFYAQNGLVEPIKYLQCQQLPYLQAIVKESTRLLPSIVYQLLRYAPENFEVRGHRIPAGTPVGISPIAQNRDTDIWGEDADLFRPERWIEDTARAKYLDSNNMTFGGNGPRMCIGKNIALVELQKFIAQFVYHFDFELIDEENPWRITTYWFAYQHDLNMKLRLRPDRMPRPVYD
ncbi:hypothetical protein ASPWEDRAFT_177239 [Aspergillus wentii DTO 134E9]|uniref:Cytochrome P450 n=1 Tax=Aspergillus wentii DTO 134E9 TaxID=1073089 RepID=A0A1L9R6P8_ASPWE|nr:uncharacterized protein ASPWEDRAFT_177239 [Aspergillus wentii DTO 134E9]KAI9926751.1 hypothetical protein MW887_003845 [Aspergillus wentii]OJJ30586.1 hypothetical protein ASPWEDRAFT_177239 [Aspergillus wentii DTO 134E9]